MWRTCSHTHTYPIYSIDNLNTTPAGYRCCAGIISLERFRFLQLTGRVPRRALVPNIMYDWLNANCRCNQMRRRCKYLWLPLDVVLISLFMYTKPITFTGKQTETVTNQNTKQYSSKPLPFPPLSINRKPRASTAPAGRRQAWDRCCRQRTPSSGCR